MRTEKAEFILEQMLKGKRDWNLVVDEEGRAKITDVPGFGSEIIGTVRCLQRKSFAGDSYYTMKPVNRLTKLESFYAKRLKPSSKRLPTVVNNRLLLQDWKRHFPGQ